MPSPPRLYAAVALGSALGGTARYIVTVAILHLAQPGFPWGTLTVNVAGSFAIGLFATLAGPDGRLLAGPALRQFVMVGVLGGLTTFSVFSLETVLLALEGRVALAALSVAASLVLWIPAAWCGHTLARHLNRLPGGDA